MPILPEPPQARQGDEKRIMPRAFDSFPVPWQWEQTCWPLVRSVPVPWQVAHASVRLIASRVESPWMASMNDMFM
jgi:hypothetical protein